MNKLFNELELGDVLLVPMVVANYIDDGEYFIENKDLNMCKWISSVEYDNFGRGIDTQWTLRNLANKLELQERELEKTKEKLGKILDEEKKL